MCAEPWKAPLWLPRGAAGPGAGFGGGSQQARTDAKADQTCLWCMCPEPGRGAGPGEAGEHGLGSAVEVGASQGDRQADQPPRGAVASEEGLAAGGEAAEGPQGLLPAGGQGQEGLLSTPPAPRAGQGHLAPGSPGGACTCLAQPLRPPALLAWAFLTLQCCLRSCGATSFLKSTPKKKNPIYSDVVLRMEPRPHLC